MRRLFWFAYVFPDSHQERRLTPVQVRDDLAATYVVSVLCRQGFVFEETIVNYPAEGPGFTFVDHGFFQPTDLILLTTRPPMDDAAEGARARKASHRSYTTLEESIFTVLRQWIRFSSRKRTSLQDAAALLSPEIREHAEIVFMQLSGADYKAVGPLGSEPAELETRAGLTAAYLVRTREAWPGGPELLAAWGMGAIQTLGWCRLLAKKHAHLLDDTAFCMAELKTGRLQNQVQANYSDAWDVRILGRAPLPPKLRAAG
jgi:hypothetical protein